MKHRPKKLFIHNPVKGMDYAVPLHLQRLCSQCLKPMPLDYYHWQSETEVTIVYLCAHKDTGRYKIVKAQLNRLRVLIGAD